jgi:hypothetical protein
MGDMSADSGIGTRTATRSSRDLILYGQALWMVVTAALLVAIRMLSFELFYIISFIGLLIMSQLFSPRSSSPRWWLRLRIVIAIGFVVFAYLLTNQSLGYL